MALEITEYASPAIHSNDGDLGSEACLNGAGVTEHLLLAGPTIVEGEESWRSACPLPPGAPSPPAEDYSYRPQNTPDGRMV
jgi:hypothetical protein